MSGANENVGPSLRSEFLQAARSFPERPALVVRGKCLTYRELESKARLWAGAVCKNLHSPQRIGVFGYRSETAYVGTLAAAMSGAAFVPLNPTFPLERTRAMIEAADLDALIVDSSASAQFEGIAASLRQGTVLMSPDSPLPEVPGLTQIELTDSTSPLDRLPPVSEDSAAYLLFTSGSTGNPKGVQITQGNVSHYLRTMRERYSITPEDRFSQTFDQTFDLSVFDLFMAWHSGACVYSMSTIELLSPAAFINEHKLTVWFSVPSVVARMRKRNLLRPDLFPSLRWSLFCGEPLPVASAELWEQAAPNSTVENLYGPTELTISCMAYRWNGNSVAGDATSDIVPIGTPNSGLHALVVDDQLGTVADGSPGELCVAGPQTCPGYWRDVLKTAERFVTLQGSDGSEQVFYRTGDRVLRESDGNYIFLGRIDDQIKVLGHRVELGEIESALRRVGGISDAVTIGWPYENGTALGTIAFATGEFDAASVLKHAAKLLPAYMVPQRIIHLREMPFNANGKVDRKALRRSLESQSCDRAEIT